MKLRMNQSNNAEQLKIYPKYLDLIYYSNDIGRKSPKSEKFSLVKEIKISNYLYRSQKFDVY